MRKQLNVSFNTKDAFEIQLLEHSLDQGAFSKYIKRLIQRDMEGIPVRRQQTIVRKLDVEADSFF
ncbi:hypothetical protein MKZ18_06710 [Priestia sp. FSL W8-0001]|uniref:hypothetical protein n=1 Tax=unclassified Priestia TaxID=2800374 RepID=UPI0030F8E7FF